MSDISKSRSRLSQQNAESQLLARLTPAIAPAHAPALKNAARVAKKLRSSTATAKPESLVVRAAIVVPATADGLALIAVLRDLQAKYGVS